MKNSTNSSRKDSKRGVISLINRFIAFEKDSTFLPPFSFGVWIFFVAGFLGSLIIGWIIFPLALYSEQPQPMNFNHALHMIPDIGIEGDTELERCLHCHAFRDDGTFAGIPSLEGCMECHDDPESPLGENPLEQRFLRIYGFHLEIVWKSLLAIVPGNIAFE